MTDPWRPLPIPMLPANDERAQVSIGAEMDTNGGDWYLSRAKAERDALEMMQKAKMLTRADEIAAEAHAGQTDKGGAPYIDLRRVAAAVSTIPAKIVALLHDVVEDCPAWTLDRLRAEGFDGDIIEAVDAMTKRRGEDYFAAILRARANTIARQVKLADLADNSDRTRLTQMTDADERRLDKYARATLMLRNA